MPTRGKKLTFLAATLAVLVLGVGALVSWPRLAAWYRFWQEFEQLGNNAEGFPEYRHRQTGIVMVRVPSSTFNMGSPEGEWRDILQAHPNMRWADELNSRFDAEHPCHPVTLGEFLIAKYELSRAEWARVMGLDPPGPNDADLPIESLSWEECQEFCRRTGLKLPTEAQWEYSCRAGTGGPFGGTGRMDEMGWYDQNSGRKTHPVGQKKPNGFGLHDMHGNVPEWCADVYDGAFYEKPEARTKNPVCTSGPGHRVFRGGGFYSQVIFCRSAYRDPSPTAFLSRNMLGVRLAYYPLP